MNLSRFFLLRQFLLSVAVASTAFAQLTHRYSFNDGTGNDSVGGANGALFGSASISGGQLMLPGLSGPDFLALPGPTIAINNYSALTFELWSAQFVGANAFTMAVAFGGPVANIPTDYLAIATTGPWSRGSIATSDIFNYETTVHGPVFTDALEHFYALTISDTELAFYVDGVQLGVTPLANNSFIGHPFVESIAAVGTDSAFLGRSVYAGEYAFQGSVDEFRIWNGALGAGTIADHFALGPNTVPEPSAITFACLAIAGLTVRKIQRSRASL